MKAAIALQCTTGNCVYQDAAPPPTPSTHQGFWTGEMITLLGMTLLLFTLLLGMLPAAQRGAHASLNSLDFSAAAGLFLHYDALSCAAHDAEDGGATEPDVVRPRQMAHRFAPHGF